MELPPEPVQRAILERYARIMARFGGDLGKRAMVLPNGEFFPDQFASDARSVRRLLKRMQTHAGMQDIPIRARLLGSESEGQEQAGSCKSGACAMPSAGADASAERIVDEGDTWRINVPELELKHPVVMTTQIARALSLIFLMESRGEEEPLDQPVDVSVDLAGVALGFGVLLLEGSYLYSKSCGGPTVARLTKLGPAELSIAFAAFVAAGKHSMRRALKELGTTQRAVVAGAHSFIESNPAVVEVLRNAPERIASGDYKLKETRPWLFRVFGSRSENSDGDPLTRALETGASLEALESTFAAMPARPSKTKVEDPRRQELRALVDEALDAPRAERADAE